MMRGMRSAKQKHEEHEEHEERRQDERVSSAGATKRGFRSLFCPSCGRRTSDLIEGLCRDCFAARIEIANVVPSRILLKYCRVCDSFFRGGERVSVERAAEDFVTREIMKRLQCEDFRVQVRDIKEMRGSISVVMRVSVVVSGVEKEEEFPLEISLRREVCEVCSRFVGGYYEAIIQLRAEGREPTEDEIRIAREIAFSSLREKDFISKEKHVRRGVDFYVSSSACARRISREIVRYLGGSVSESPKLYGRVEGRNVYRVSFSVRLPPH